MKDFQHKYKLELWYTVGKIDGVALHAVVGDLLAKEVFVDKLLDELSPEDMVYDVEGFDYETVGVVLYSLVMFSYDLSEDGEILLDYDIEVI